MATATKTGNGRLTVPPQVEAKPEIQAPTIIRPINIRQFMLQLRGTSPLIVHKFSEKSKRDIEAKQQKESKGAKEARKPRDEYIASFYMMPGSPAAEAAGAKYGFPAAGFKLAAVDACSFIDGITKVEARGAFHVTIPGGLIEILHSTPPRMREDTVRIGMGTLDLRYRPEFIDWHCELPIRYNAAVLSVEQIVNLYNNAGFSIGVGEWRPQKDGSNGMFEVPTE